MDDPDLHLKAQEQITEGVEEQHATAIASVTSQALLDPSIQYQFRTENGQGVTYRVVQVAPEAVAGDAVAAAAGGAQVVTSAALVGQQVAQAIISSPFANANGSSSPTAEGQFYVMMSPQDVLQTTPRTLAPRTHQFSQKSEGNRTARDEGRRATHNEVERRRRDKINNWIVKLSKIIPDCSSDLNKSGQQSSVHLHSKGGILAKACDYIQDLRNANARLPDILKENERLAVDVELLRQQCDELKAANQILKAHLQQHGITVAEPEQHTS